MRVLAEFRNRTKAGETVRVQGHYAELKETECVLIFDGTSFRLEHLAGSGRRMNVVRPSRATTTTSSSSSSSTAATPQKGESSSLGLPATTSPTSTSSPSSTSSSPTAPPASGVSTVSHKRPRMTVAGKTPSSAAAAVSNGVAGKRPRTSSSREDSEDEASNLSGDKDDGIASPPPKGKTS